jgi:hypothetical protein
MWIMRGTPDRALRYVLATILLIALAGGGVVTYRLLHAKSYFRFHTERLLEFGQTASIPDCVGAVLDWRRNCEAMVGLCDQSVSRLMGACLAGQSREAACASYGDTVGSTTFGYADCKPRIASRSDKKACAGAWRAVAFVCKEKK